MAKATTAKATAKKLKLELEPRAALGTRGSRGLRRKNLIPAVVYGEGKGTVPVQARLDQVLPVVQTGARLVDISVGGAESKALIKEVQYDALGKHVLHLDLYRIAMDVQVEVTVPIQLRGTPIGAQEGGVLEQQLRELHVKCLPANIPERLRADVSGLKVNDTLLAGQIPLPEGVGLARSPDVIVAIVKIPVEKVEEPAAEGETPKEPEVLVGPKDKEGAEEEAGETEAKPAKAEKAEKPEKEKK